MMDAIVGWLTDADFLPHGYCLAWAPGLLWTMVISNAVIGIAYYSIPLSLVYFMRRQRHLVKFNWVFAMFGLFIFACGTTHFIDIASIWIPVYRLDATVMVLTAAISIVTAVMIWPLVPQATALLEERANTTVELRHLNHQLGDSLAQLQQRGIEAENMQRRFRMTFENAPIGLAIVGLDGRWQAVNQALCAMLGYTEQELLQRTFQEVTHPDDLAADLRLVDELLSGRRDRYRMEKRYFHKAGNIISIQLDVALVRDENGLPVHFIAQIMDITARKSYEASLHEAKELAQVTLSSIGDGVIRTDAQGVITFCNQAAATILDLLSEQLIGRVFSERVHLLSDDGSMPIQDPVTRVLATGESVRLDIFSGVRVTGGEIRPISDSVSPVRDIAGKIIGAVFVFQDVSDARQMTEKLSFLANHDVLTGLPNRLAFEVELQKRLAEARKNGTKGYLLYLDLDHFKVVNDTRGHAAGDKLLCGVSEILSGRLRKEDYIARLGGDEFAIFIRTDSVHEAQAMAESLIETINSYEIAFNDRLFKVGLSVGITEISSTNCDASAVMAQADTACYAAKDHGRGRCQIYRIDDVEILQAERTMDWAQRIQHAFDHSQYEVHLQQIVGRDLQLLGYEALIRMRDEHGQVIMPNAFLPAAKRLGWMSRIDQWMAGEVLSLARAQTRGGSAAYLSLNLSAKSAGDPDFARTILSLLDKHQINQDLLRFEITETEQLQASAAETHLVGELRRRGFRVWLDDFGTGYNSFDLLKRMPVDGIKLDASFTRDLLRDPVDRALSEAIISIGKAMHLEIVAEGVEDEATQQALLAMGVDAMQGHLFHHAQQAGAALKAA